MTFENGWTVKPFHLGRLRARFVFLALAILLYAIAGSPTPDNPGVMEMSIGLCLMMAVGWRGIVQALNVSRPETTTQKLYHFFFLYGLIVPTLVAFFTGNETGWMMRDVLSFLFLGLPVFFNGALGDDKPYTKWLSALLLCAGLAFSIRTLVPVLNIWVPQGELIYLSNSPLVVMAAVFFILWAWEGLADFTVPSFVWLFLKLLCVFVLVSAMLLDVQRATIGAVFLSVLFVALMDFYKKPKAASVTIGLFSILLVLLWPALENVFSVMVHKTADVGMNARFAEISAVYAKLCAGGGLGYLFGYGWGATFSSPAVAGLEVNFTHSWLTTMLLKGGIVFFGLCSCVFIRLVYEILLIFQRDRSWGLALGAAFVIPSLLYASHKSLDFGLILLMIMVWSDKVRAWTTGPYSFRK
jgi:hypothetical protein